MYRFVYRALRRQGSQLSTCLEALHINKNNIIPKSSQGTLKCMVPVKANWLVYVFCF